MLGATFARRFPSAVRSDRVAPAVKLKLPGDPPLRRYELPRALVVIHQHRQLPVGSIPSSPQFVPPGRLLGRRVHRWPLRATSSIGGGGSYHKALINEVTPRVRELSTVSAAELVIVEKSLLLVRGASVRANHLNN